MNKKIYKMKKSFLITGIAILITTLSYGQSVHQPFQLALWNTVQIVPQELSVQGFRWNIIYGINENVNGFDMGIVNKTNGYQKGAQFGILNQTVFEFSGFRSGIVNFSGGEFKGFETGIVNQLESDGNGWVAGCVNIVNDDFKGLLSGICNIQYADKMEGAHIGIVNLIRGSKKSQGEEKTENRKGTQIGVVNVTESLDGVQIGLINVNKSARIKFFPFILVSKKS